MSTGPARLGGKLNGKTLLFLFISMIFLTPMVQAQINCSATTSGNCSDTIVLYVENDTGGYTNAHVQNISEATYNYAVCCNADTINETVETTCGGNADTFLRLSDITNAHVQAPNGTDYPVNACIGVTNRIVSCAAHQTTCPEGYYCIVSIANSEGDNYTNAHVDASCNDYETKICCGFTNTPPAMNSVNITPEGEVYSNETLEGYCQADDADADAVKYYYYWYLNDSLNASGTTGFVAQGSPYNVDSISNTITLKGQSWILECLADDGLQNSSLQNSTTVNIVNSPPTKPIPDKPDDGDIHYTDRTPRFNWTASNDYDSDTITYDLEVSILDDFTGTEINETDLSNNYYATTNELEFGTYYWRIRAYDGTNYSEWTSTQNFTLEVYLAIVLTNNTINFGQLFPYDTANTSDNDPPPFTWLSNSNTYINLTETKTSQSLWQSQPLNTEYWQIRSRPGTGNFDEANSITQWTNVNSSIPNMISSLNYTSGSNTAEIDMYVLVPAVEPPGQKQQQINFTWEATG